MSQVSSLFSKNRNVCLLSFFTTAFIFTLVILAGNVYPIGDQCILRTDMYHQYAPFFSELREKLQTGGSLYFTWDLGLGVNFAAIIAYYLSSPFNLLLMFVSEEHVIEFMSVLIVVKAALSSATMSYFLMSGSPKNGFAAWLIGMFYGLSGYMCAYYWNIMWLDCIIMFPLVVLGAKRLINGHSGIMYGICLGLCILTNYYISIPICAFLIIYFFAESFLDRPESVRSFLATGIRFAAWSLIAGGLAAVMLLPEIYAFTLTVSSSNDFPKNVTDYFPLFTEMFRHLPFVETEQGLDHWPNIYCGTFVIPLFFLYIQNRRISLKEKAVNIILAFVFLAGFAVNVLNFMWHGMHYPNSLPARQSFIYIFIVLCMCFRVCEESRSITRRQLARALGLSLVFVLYAQSVSTDDALGFEAFYAGLIFTAIYVALIHLYRKRPNRKIAVCGFMALMAIAELSANTAYTSITTTSRKSFTSDNDSVRQLVKAAEEMVPEPGFYRMERAQRKSKNDGAWLNFPSASLFSSMAGEGLSSIFRKLGCEASTNAYSITGSTPFVDMLLGINYELDSNGDQETGLSHIEAEAEGMYLYERTYALSPAFMMPQKMSTEWMTDLDDPAVVQNNLCDLLATEQVLIPVYNGGASRDGEFALTIPETGLYYAYEDNHDAGDVTVKWSDSRKTFNNLERNYFMELGRCERGELINFKAEKPDTDPDITVYRLNENAVRELYEELSQAQLDITGYDDGFLRGNVTVDTKALGYNSGRANMLITIPYDEGWTVYVDGEETEAYKCFGAFLSIYLSDGIHDVMLKYEPKGLSLGMLISGLSLLVILGAAARMWILRRRGIHGDAA